MIINYTLIIDLFIPDWPNLNTEDKKNIKNIINDKLKTHCSLIPVLLKIALNFIFIFFIIYYFFCKLLHLVSFKKFNLKYFVLKFFHFTVLFSNFERFFRSLICLYFYENLTKY